jgi:hypothetical protein
MFQRTNKGKTLTGSHNLFVQALVAQVNDSPSLAKAMVNPKSQVAKSFRYGIFIYFQE